MPFLTPQTPPDPHPGDPPDPPPEGGPGGGPGEVPRGGEIPRGRKFRPGGPRPGGPPGGVPEGVPEPPRRGSPQYLFPVWMAIFRGGAPRGAPGGPPGGAFFVVLNNSPSRDKMGQNGKIGFFRFWDKMAGGVILRGVQGGYS